jgi:hypothetical protein
VLSMLGRQRYPSVDLLLVTRRWVNFNVLLVETISHKLGFFFLLFLWRADVVCCFWCTVYAYTCPGSSRKAWKQRCRPPPPFPTRCAAAAKRASGGRQSRDRPSENTIQSSISSDEPPSLSPSTFGGDVRSNPRIPLWNRPVASKNTLRVDQAR